MPLLNMAMGFLGTNRSSSEGIDVGPDTRPFDDCSIAALSWGEGGKVWAFAVGCSMIRDGTGNCWRPVGEVAESPRVFNGTLMGGCAEAESTTSGTGGGFCTGSAGGK